MKKNYFCKKCQTFITNERQPNSNGCPSGGYHQWIDLGEYGDNRFQCRKCGLIIYSRINPRSNDCPSGGHHLWNKL